MDAIFNPIAMPFGWLLNILYDFVQDYAMSLLLVAVVVKIILLPFQMKGKRGMMRQTRLQPKISELQKKHGANKQKLNEEMAKLYKEEGVNPASGCLWSFIQMPIMIALFYVIRQPLTLMMGVPRALLEEGGAIYEKLQEMNFVSTMQEWYVQIDQAQFITANFEVFAPLSENLHKIYFTLGIVNLATVPDYMFWNFPWSDSAALLPVILLFLFPIISGGAQFISAAIMRKMNAAGSPEAAAGAAGAIIKFMPLMSVWFGFILPAALSFYWTIGTILQIFQDIWLTKKYTKILDEEDAVKAEARKAKEAELEVKRLETERRKAEGIAEQDRNTSKRKKKKGSRQGQIEKAAEWEKKNKPASDSEEKYEPGRVGNRRYARGRAYRPDRFSNETEENVLDLTDEDIEVDGIAVEQSADDAYEYEETDTEDIEDASDDSEDENDIDAEDDEDGDDFDDDDDGDFDDDDDGDFDDGDDDDDEEDDDSDDDDDSEAPPTTRFETKRFDSDN